VKRLTLFAKGNVDVHDSLHSCRIAGAIAWNGVNEALRHEHPGWSVRLRHETWTRSDATLGARGSVPEELAGRDLALGSYPLASQFSRAVFESAADAIILSLQPDVTTTLVRHRRDGFLFYPSDMALWNAQERRWLASEFEALEELSVATSLKNFSTIIAAIRAHRDVPILIYNLSAITPGEMLHCYQGLEGTLSSRIKEFNVGLIRLSEETGISIVDVDSLVARNGGEALKLDTTHLTPLGYQIVAKEVIRVLDDLGCFLTEDCQPLLRT
jgi:hypothetical protein